MQVELWQTGKTKESYLEAGIGHYTKRLKHYLRFQILTFPDQKNTASWSPDQFREKEGQSVLEKLRPDDYLVLLDERGQIFTSVGFSKFLEKTLAESPRRLIFLIGGAYGFSDAVRQAARTSLSLSALTFPHQLVRLIFLEQLYRACTIMRNEPYHNEG